MQGRGLSMRKIRDILRLRFENQLSFKNIAKCCHVSSSTALECVTRASAKGLSWPLVESLDDNQLETMLYPRKSHSRVSNEAIPDWSSIRDELTHKGVTLELLWREYTERHPDGFGYSYFCELFSQWLKKSRISMRQIHLAGEKLFVDFAGKKVPIFDSQTGKIQWAEVFVAVWGASNFTYAEAVLSEDLPSWIKCHVNAFEYFGCVSHVVVPDNLKAAITKACRYDPDVNPAYQELASHYGFAVIPARVRKPKDKAHAEFGVRLVTRWIIAALRKRKFFSLSELNAAIREHLEKLNDKPFQKKPGSRRSAFEAIDKPAAKDLPSSPYCYAEILRTKVNIDYHIEVDGHYYSLPYQLRGEHVIVRLTGNAVEILFKNKRLLTHVRSYKKYGYTTLPEHLPERHRQYQEWKPSRIVSWAATIGPWTKKAVIQIIETRPHPEQGYRQCLGILRLAQFCGGIRMENACARAFSFNAVSYGKIKSILDKGLENTPNSQKREYPQKIIQHQNLRGSDYYQQSLFNLGENTNDDASNAGETSGIAPFWDGSGFRGTEQKLTDVRPLFRRAVEHFSRSRTDDPTKQSVPQEVGGSEIQGERDPGRH